MGDAHRTGKGLVQSFCGGKVIEHKTQPTKDSCMATCIAMLVGIDENKAYAEWHHKFQNRSSWLDTALDKYGIPYLYGSPRSATLLYGFAYLLTVPSLNIQGGLHQVIAILCKEGGVEIFDPVKGRGGLYYVYESPAGDKEVEIKSWAIDLAIPLQTYQQ